ncbi:MAG: hypothetical protein EBV77_07530 [Gemmatimonadaceae bacterium]|nr:hypothetical protein [Gemmatimonadaceae bacterium]
MRVHARHAGHGDDAVAVGPHEPPGGDLHEGRVEQRRRGGRGFGGGALGKERRRREGEREEDEAGAEAHGHREWRGTVP